MSDTRVESDWRALADRLAEALRAMFLHNDDHWNAEGNAPGHAHKTPPLWDESGDTCNWCSAWTHAKSVLAEYDAARGQQ